MEKDNNEEKFIIEGNPGQGNTFVKIGKVENYVPNATTVTNTTTITNNHYYGKREEEEVSSTTAKPGDKKLGNMNYRDLLKEGYIDTGNMKKLIMNYVSCIQPYVKKEMESLYLRLWTSILDHEAFKVELYDPGKQDCKFNRNLVGNIMHYLEEKGFYREPYNQSEMTRAVEGEADNPVRKGFGGYLDKKYKVVVDEILKKLQEKIESIIPAVEKRTAPQTLVDMPYVSQVNINPHEVKNEYKKVEE